MTQPTRGPVVFTNKAKCRDCYRCIRSCPVKAIRMENGQASIVEERCIHCGTCIRECPRNAKSFRNDLDRVRDLVKSAPRAAVSIAPSFAGLYAGWKRDRLIAALRKLGFSYVGETAVGAYPVAVETVKYMKEHPGKNHIATACPAVVNHIERYRTEALDDLVPVVSPMIAHARLIREKMGEDTCVIFIGPCIAKKGEAERPELEGIVDGVLTFQELDQWLDEEEVNLDELEESGFDETPAGDARLFPLVSGLAATGGLSPHTFSENVLACSGFTDLEDALNLPRGGTPRLIEPLFCEHGCINGPGAPAESSVFQRKEDVVTYAGHGGKAKADEPNIQLETHFESKSVAGGRIDEGAIRRVLEETGQASPEDELNCGACGYPSCRERAIAVLQGMAEPEMCIPYMRRLAVQRGDRIIQTSPNGIVILDSRLNILHMNPAFQKMFMCSEAVCGRRISYLMDPEPFEQLSTGEKTKEERTVVHDKYGVVCHQIMYSLADEKQYVGIFVNVTQNRQNREKLERLQQETVLQAQELMDHQIRMAQKIAEFLGESTAKGEKLVDNLIRLGKDDALNKEDKKRDRHGLPPRRY